MAIDPHEFQDEEMETIRYLADARRGGLPQDSRVFDDDEDDVEDDDKEPAPERKPVDDNPR